jgi:hypothetical protein
MQKGSLTIGDQLLNYGGGSNWSSNTAGLLFECENNTEIAVHDAGHRIASLMYFEGGGTNKITIGRNMGPWSAISNVDINGTITATGDKLNFPNTLNQYKINLWGTNNYGFGIAGGTLMYSSQGNHTFYNSNNNDTTFNIDSSGNVNIKGAITTGNFYSFLGGLRINGSDTGNTIWQNTGNLGISANTGNNIIFYIGNGLERMRINNSGRIGVANTNPQSMLHLGNCEVINSAPVIVFGKNVNNVGFRNAFMGYTDSFFFVIGDYGSTNAGSNALTSQLAIIYNAPASSLVIQGSGYVRMAYGFGNGSDERIKSNIKTIENALDKTLLLRGVEFNLNIEPERKRIGLIAQEVELIVPEVVRTSEDDGLKSIEYQNLVGLLIESIKDQQKQINELKNILIKNNLN